MILDGYSLCLRRYPGLPEIAPFHGWNSIQPTKSLIWYDVYNRVKHDREANFKDATLGNAIQAVAGCVVMLAAQFGHEALGNYRFKSLFQFTKIPMWEPKYWYYGPLPNVPWQMVNWSP